jgi:signal transduction histidine kinase
MADSRGPRPSLLVADADPQRRGELARLLRSFGHEVVEVKDASAALRVLREAPIDAVFVDSGLPPLGALDLLNESGGLLRNLPLFLLASPGNIREAVQAMQHGARNYLTRPLVPQELVEALREVLPHPPGLSGRGRGPREEPEEQARQARKMEAVGRLAGGVAHDFNNLLTVVNGYASILQGSLAPEHPLRPLVEEILKAVERGAAVTRQLLAFSRKQVLQPVVFDLNQVVVKMEKMLRPLIGEHVELDLQLASLACPIKADPTQLEQVIVNLAVNARDAMPSGGKLRISTSEQKSEIRNQRSELRETLPALTSDLRPLTSASWVLLRVTDSGCGMDAATRAHLFEPFFTTKEPGKGTGLGLATVHGIVEQCGGRIEVNSEPGHGTTFTILLPRADEPLPAAGSGGAPLSMPRGTETILLIEDEQPVRTLVRRVLEMQGYAVLEAQTGSEAIALSARHAGPIHLLISDVIMPQMNGYELAQRLTQVRRDLRVLFITGHNHSPLVDQILREASAAVLPKPFTPGPLAFKVREALDRHP